jgi:hypothetical protein
MESGHVEPSQTFAIIPAGPRAIYLLIPFVLLVLGALGFLVLTAYGSQRATFELAAAGLRFHGDAYGRTIPWSAIDGAQARLVDLTREPSLRPKIRRLGTALPGYRSGWFRLANGERALLYITDSHRVIYVPTTLGYAVLLTPQSPERFLAELQQRARRP